MMRSVVVWIDEMLLVVVGGWRGEDCREWVGLQGGEGDRSRRYFVCLGCFLELTCGLVE